VTDVQVGRGIIDGSGNVVITLALVAHNLCPPRKIKIALDYSRATK
jgi:hypothetical protein